MKIYRIEAEASDDSSGHIDISDFYASREMAEKALKEYNGRGRQSCMWRYYDSGAYIAEYELITNE